ncbi:uncharacterized protein LOC111070920 [Drosophila obscura]|uniref:uncharacterized protein LOC111070920 n=1 Tax=Drosophila obscura TaxID=7282 RepID=UPI001BB2AC57|nr:uncharacterized protein LOC111070920 [Drosophila obscura]
MVSNPREREKVSLGLIVDSLPKHSLRLLVLLGLLMAAAQARIIESEVATEQEKVPPAQQIGASPEAVKPVEVEKLKENLGIQENQVIPEETKGIQANQGTPEVKPEVNQQEQQQKEQVTGPILPKDEQQKGQAEQPKEQAEQPKEKAEQPKEQAEQPKEHVEQPKEQAVEGKGQVKGREIELVFEQPGQVLLQYDNVGQLQGLPNLDKIFKYSGVQQQLNATDAQYLQLFNKFQTAPKVEYVPALNTTGANATQHIHNHTHYYQSQNQKKPFPFLPNLFEKQETTYVNSTSPSGNVTYVYEEGKPSGGGAFPFPPLPNPFTDFPKVVGLSLVLLPNPFYKEKSYNAPSSNFSPTESTRTYFEKFRGFADESSANQQQNQPPKTGNRFYLISNPLLNHASEEGRGEKNHNTNVLLPVNLAALPLLVPAPETNQETSSKQEPTVGHIKIEDLLKTSKFYVGQPLQFPTGNGIGIGIGSGQKQSQDAAIRQLILAQLNQQQQQQQQQKLQQLKLPLKDERRSQAAAVPVEEGEESSVLFAVEIPKPIYRFFKGIFGGFSG